MLNYAKFDINQEVQKRGEIVSTKITKSSGNVFLDIGFSVQEAENLHIRSRLMIEIARYIKENNLTQVKAAKILGVTQPRINDIVKGKIDTCSIDKLVNMLARAGKHVDVVISDKAA